jgi:KipI family sensor histidine kinase inhibitor
MTALVLFEGEDILTASCDENAMLQARAEFFRQSGLWEEVVQGMADLTVKYDPLAMTGEEADSHFRKLWDAPLPTGQKSDDVRVLDASFADNDAPDRVLVTDVLGITVEALPEWLSQRIYRVAMMGFQPGFAYLEDSETAGLPTLARLATPRQRVAAGSIGFLGGRACIYALDGPGGWPIVGRVHEPLFRRDHPRPFLLKPGQMLRFRPV